MGLPPITQVDESLMATKSGPFYGVIHRCADYPDAANAASGLRVSQSEDLPILHATTIGGVPRWIRQEQLDCLWRHGEYLHLSGARRVSHERVSVLLSDRSGTPRRYVRPPPPPRPLRAARLSGQQGAMHPTARSAMTSRTVRSTPQPPRPRVSVHTARSFIRQEMQNAPQ
jgi:hypothetical protein